MPQPFIIDPEVVKSLRALNNGDDDDFFREIVGLFSDDVPRRIGELEESLASGDQARFKLAAHSIKGTAANVGAEPLRAAAERLEKRAAGELKEIEPGLAEIKGEFARAKAELERIARASGP